MAWLEGRLRAKTKAIAIVVSESPEGIKSGDLKERVNALLEEWGYEPYTRKNLVHTSKKMVNQDYLDAKLTSHGRYGRYHIFYPNRRTQICVDNFKEF